ncbi:MAG TPA: tRNA lysidine(34) synthetase TilS [Actinomycetota bacterium]|nr:tRNA lysidine(34) synthetase TilS [Actinomycetota bacterium]
MQLTARVAGQMSRAGLEAEDVVGVAVSGGSDSTALLMLLGQALPRMSLHVLHVDHRLREDSSHDAQRVRELCEHLALPCHVLQGRLSESKRMSPQERARELRYRLLDRAAAQLGCSAVATGHTADDQAETVLARLLRGCGTKGAAGIPRRRGLYVRPLLDCTRHELREWLSGRGVGWVDDPTNDVLRYERTWIRREVLPAMEARRPGAARALARHAGLAALDEDYIQSAAAAVYAGTARSPGGLLLSNDQLAGHPAVASRVVRMALTASGADAGGARVDEVLSLRDRRTGVVRAGAADVWRVGSGLAFVQAGAVSPVPAALPDNGQSDVPGWGLRVRVGRGPLPVEGWAWTCNLDDVRGGLTLRSRRPGERVPTRAGTRKVQDVLVDARIPRGLRDSAAVLAVGDSAVAVVGLTAPPQSGDVVVQANLLGSPLDAPAWLASPAPGP